MRIESQKNEFMSNLRRDALNEYNT